MTDRHKLTFRTCGPCPHREDPLSCNKAACPTKTVSIKRVEQTNDMLVAHAFPWCRARLLHALGAAEEQGILAEVLEELMGGGPGADAIRNSLHQQGWAKT